MRRELLGDALLGRDGVHVGLRVLRAGRRGDLIPRVYLKEAVELRKNQLAVLLVLGSYGLGWLPGACSCGGASGGAWRLRELSCCGLVRRRQIDARQHTSWLRGTGSVGDSVGEGRPSAAPTRAT